MTIIERLTAIIAALAPIDGISVPLNGTSANVRIDFKVTATSAQITAAQNALATFDWSNAAQATWEDQQQPNHVVLLQAAAQAVIDNNTYLAIVAPTNAQVVAQVKALTQQNIKMIKRFIEIK